MQFGSQRIRFLAGLLLLLAGLEITVTLTYMARWVGFVLMLFGIGILVLTARKKPQAEEKIEGPKEPSEEEKTLADYLIFTLTLKGKIRIMLPVIGIFLILLVYAFNLTRYGNLEIGVNDTITILLGLTLIIYNYVPEKYKKERDFVFLFFIFLFFILVVPITLYSMVSGPIPESPNSPFIYHLLAEPTSDMLNLFGIESYVKTVPPNWSVEGEPLPSGVNIVYRNIGDIAIEEDGVWNAVGIGLSCTGLYSVSIFISGFIAFIFIEYRRFDIRVASLLTLGVFTSWFANILRMTIIVAVGSHYGQDALIWTHANLGIFIFMIWVGIFWGVMFKLLMPKEEAEEAELKGEEDVKEEKPEIEKEGEPPKDNSHEITEKQAHSTSDEFDS